MNSISQNTDVTFESYVKYASQKTREEISFGDAALFPIREISRLNHFVILPFGHRSK